MARPVWTGALTFGLVTVPISLYTATQSHDVHFHQLQRGTSDRVRNKRVNERTGEEVEFGDIVKGFEVSDGEYVVVEPEELDRISPGRSRTIEISGFVELADVDPIFFDRTYYLGPRGPEYSKVYALLVEALEHAGKAGLAMFSMRGKEYLTAVRSEAGLLELHTMHFADEVRDPRTEIGDLPEEVEVSGKEIRAAEQLIDMLAVDWDPAAYHDTYEEQVRKLIEDKLAGREIAVATDTGPEGTNVVDLMEVLRRSLESAGGKPGGGATGDATGGGARAGTGGGADGADGADGGDAGSGSGGTAGSGGRRARSAPAAARSTPKEAGAKKSTSRAAGPARDDGGGDGGGGAKAGKRVSATGKQQLSRLTKAELYKRATDLDIPQRSTMTRDELQHALEQAGRTHRKAS